MTDFFKAQMDYIFFVYGLSFVVLGFICFAFSKEDEESRIKLPTQFFGLFALLHGFNEWLDMIAMTLFENRTFVIIRLIVMALSFLFLLEFARRSAGSTVRQQEPGNRGNKLSLPTLSSLTFGYWIYIPLLLLAASGVWFGIAGANATVRYFIGFVSASFSGWVFYQAARYESDDNRPYLLVLGIAFGVYGILAGLVVPVSQLPPARWINNDSFVKFTGVPVQLFRAVSAGIISLAFSCYNLNIERKDILRYKQASRRALITSIFIISLVFIVIAGWSVTSYFGANGERETEKEGRLKNEIFLEQLNSEMQKVDQAVTAMSMYPHLAAALSTKRMESLNEIMDWFLRTINVDVCYLLDSNGTTVASSNRKAPDSFVGISYDFRPYFQQAIRGSHGRYLALGKTSLERGYYGSFPVRDNNDIIIGVAVIKKNIQSVEASLQKHQYAFLASPDGIIFMSSPATYLFKSLWPVDEKKKVGLLTSRQFGDLTFEAVLDREPADGSYITLTGKQFFVSRRPVGKDGWSLVFFNSTKNRSMHRMAGIAIMFTFSVFVIVAFYVLMKREIELEAVERIARLNQEYRFLVDSSSDFIFRHNAHRGITFVSPSVEAITGRSPQEWITHYSDYLTDNPINRRVIEYLGSAPDSSGEVRFYEAEIYHKDGRKITLDIREQPTIEDGNEIDYIGNARDITERKKLEDQLLHAQKMEAVGTLAGGIAHDFNNILNVIIGYGTMVLDSLEANSPFKGQMNEVLAAAEKAANLTKRLLTFSRKQVIEVKPVNINELILCLQKMLARIIGEDIDINLDLADRSLVVMADAGQIEQVLMNLASNARAAMPKGGRLSIGTSIQEIDDEYIAVNGYGNPGIYAIVTVSDTGFGIDADTQKKIFEPFFTTKGIGEGTGLGLAISYAIIKQHSGYIKVYSEPGQGTVFKIYLPLLDKSAFPNKTEGTYDSVKGGTETILVAEDDASLRKLTRLILESFGYIVVAAEDGEDAIAKFMENCDRIDLVLLDMIMPKKNGKEVSEVISKVSPMTKILFVSGYTMDTIKNRELTESGFDFIYKPVSSKDLLKKVREILDK